MSSELPLFPISSSSVLSDSAVDDDELPPLEDTVTVPASSVPVQSHSDAHEGVFAVASDPSPPVINEAEFLSSLPPRIRADFSVQLDSLPVEMKATVLAQLVGQVAQWTQNPGNALLLAVKNHNYQLVKMLIQDFNAPVDYPDPDGNTALHWAGWYKNPQITEFLLEKGANVNIHNTKLQYPIHWACMGGELQCVRQLVQYKTALDMGDEDGYQPVHCAAQHGHTILLDYLLLQGADLSALDKNSRTVLHWSAFKNELITTQYLVERGIELTVKDTQGRTCLHWAASQNNIAIVQYLVEEAEFQGENGLINQLDDAGNSPLQVAEKKDAKRVIHFLKEYSHLKRNPMREWFESIFCLKSEGKQRKTFLDRKGKFGVYIGAWIHFMLMLSGLHYGLAMKDNIPDLLDSTHVFFVLTMFSALALYWATHLKNPGYIPKDGSVSGGNSSKGARSSASRNDNQEDEKAVLVDMDSLSDADGVDVSKLSYTDCLERGLADAICVTCRIIKEPRTKHCKACDRCVTRFDHHCPWVHTCVGGGNHIEFLCFLFAMLLALSSYTILTFQYFANDAIRDDAWRFVIGSPLLLHNFLMAIYVLLLMAQQYGIIFENLTTNEKINAWRYEYLKDAEGQFYNPFDQGKLGNCLAFFRLKQQKQPKILHRKTNPAQAMAAMAAMRMHAHAHSGGHGGGGHGHSHGSGHSHDHGHSHSHGSGHHGHSH